MLNTQQSRQLCELPQNSGAFYDSYNHLVYYTQGSQLFQHNLHTSTTKAVRLKRMLPGTPEDIPQIPRLVPVSESSSAYISPSGLAIVNGDSQETFVSTVGFSKGVHFWEFYCPVSLYGLTFGIARKEGSGYIYQTFEFVSSTSRTVSFKLDLTKLKIEAWVNRTVPNRMRNKQLEKHTWFPCIKLKGKGNPILFNPFASDPEGIISPYVITP